MTQEDFLTEVEKLLRAPRGTLKETDRLKDYPGWDSLAMIEFVALVDDTFRLDIVADEVRRAERVGELIAMTRVQA
jgi:acyl carrier protein